MERKVGNNVDRAGELVVLKKPGHSGDGECRLIQGEGTIFGERHTGSSGL